MTYCLQIKRYDWSKLIIESDLLEEFPIIKTESANTFLNLNLLLLARRPLNARLNALCGESKKCFFASN